MNELIARLHIDGPALSQRVLDDMYQDPFWMERFGNKGRRHANEDSDFHLKYLARALSAGDPGVLVRYARWLREVLCTRGMCTRHLADNFRRLGDLLAAQGWPGGELAVGFLDVARDALLWKEGPGGALEREEARIGAAISRPGLEEPARDLVSYLADAVALGQPALFARHLAWMEGHLARRGVAASEWRGVVDALEQELAGSPHSEALDCVRAAKSGQEGPR
jgi:hypothetical protein